MRQACGIDLLVPNCKLKRRSRRTVNAMSDDDVMIFCMRNGEPYQFERKLAEEIFHSGIVDDEYTKHYDIRYPDGGANAVWGDNETLDTISFYHCGGPTFFDKVWEFADRTGSMIVWIGWGVPRAVTRSDMLQHLPKEMENEELEPFVVLNGKELAEIIVSTS
jgi:hypothetical protein